MLYSRVVSAAGSLSHPIRTPKLAIAVDVAAAGVLFLLAAARHVGRETLRLGPIRISAGSVWRVVAIVVAALIVRNVLARRSPSFVWLFAGARDPLPFEERQLFDDAATWPAIGRRALWSLLGFTALAVAITWPQARHIHA